MRLGKYERASQDCRAAIKLQPNLTKAHVHLSKALRFKNMTKEKLFFYVIKVFSFFYRAMGEFKEAVTVLEIAESQANEAAG